MVIYASEDDGTLYSAESIDVDPATGQAEGFTRYEVDDTFTLTAQQILGHYGSIVEILFGAGVLRK